MLKCSNGRRLYILDRHEALSIPDFGEIPCVVMLSAWDVESVSIDNFRDIVRSYIKRDIIQFMCVGDKSELLHDIIDGQLLCLSEESNLVAESRITTTFHVDECACDMVNYFVHGTCIEEQSNCCLLAVIGGDSEEEQELRKALQNA